MKVHHFSLIIYLFLCVLQSATAQNAIYANKRNNQIIYGDSIKLFLNSEILIEPIISQDRIVSFKRVFSVQDSSRTIKLEFYFQTFGSEKSTVLTISNFINRQLHYRAFLIEKKNYYKETSVVPVIPGTFSMEVWPYMVQSIILTGFKLN